MKHEIEVPDLPEGYRAVAYRIKQDGEAILTHEGVSEDNDKWSEQVPWLIVEKIKPRRRVFECVSEKPRKAVKGEFFENSENSFTKWSHDEETTHTYKIWREVKEES